MRAVTHRGSSLPGTARAPVPQPTGAPDTACRQRRPASPRRCVGCAPYSRVRRQPHGLKDCHTLCPDTGVGVPPRWAVVVRPNGVQGRLQQRIVHVCSRNHNAQGAALSIHKETALGTSLATVRRVGPNQGALPMAPSAACHSQSTPSNSSHPSTRAPHIRCKSPYPPLKGAMKSAAVPLAAQRKMMASVRALAAPGFGRVFLQDDRFDPFPKLVRTQMVSRLPSLPM